MTGSTRNWRILGAGLFALALGLRLLYLVEQSRANPLFDHPVVDAAVYTTWANEIVNGQWWWPDLRNYLPTYPWFLALCTWFLYGSNPWSVKLVQSLLAAGAAVMLASAARRAFGARAGIAAGLLFAVNWLFVVYDAERYAESLCLSALAAWIFLSLCARPGWGRTLLGGLACALACSFRPNLLPLLLAGAVWIGLTERKRLLHSAAFLAVAVALFAPILYHNHQLTGRWMLRAQQQWNLYAALDPEIGGLHPASGVPFEKYMKQPIVAAHYRHEDQDRYWGRQSVRLLKEQPGKVLQNYLGRRGLIFLDAVEWSQEFDAYAFRACSAVLRLPWPGFGWVFPLAGVGLLFLARRREGEGDEDVSSRRAARFLLTCLAIAAACTFALKAAGRYRLPVTFFLIPFAGAGVDRLLGAGRGRWATWLEAVAVFLAFGLLSWPDWAGLRYRQTALHDFYIAEKYQKAGRPAEAEAAYRLAMREQPWDANAPCELAKLLQEQKRMPEAMEAVATALRIEPEFWRAWSVKASIELDQGENEAALEDLDQSLKIMPVQPGPWMLKTRAYAATGRWEEEKAAYEQAILLGAGAAFALGYGLRLEDRGFFQEALRQYADVAQDPDAGRFDRARARVLAGYVHALRLRQPDRAKEQWDRAVAEFPDISFYADQAQFLNGRISEEEYRARAEAVGRATAVEFFDFNRGVRAFMSGDSRSASAAFRECLARAQVSPSATAAPDVLPQKWAYNLLKTIGVGQ